MIAHSKMLTKGVPMAYSIESLNTRKSNRRKAIIQAAIKVFAQKGFHVTKIADIAKVADVADGTIYLYFENKDDLLIKCFEEMITDLLDRAQKRLEPITDKVEKIHKFIDMHIEFCENNPNAAKLLIIELRQSPEFYNKYPDFWPISSYLHFLNNLCKDAIHSDRIRSIDPDLLTTIIFGSLDFSMTSWLLSKNKTDLVKIKKGIADILYKGLEKKI
jgi:TetR/AcrR family fatty acid metabolism transcriptional regulator